MDKRDVMRACMAQGVLLDDSAAEFVAENNINIRVLAQRAGSSGMFLTKRSLVSLLNEAEAKPVEVKGSAGRTASAADYEGSVELLSSVCERQKERDLSLFVDYFNDRYEKIKNMLLAHRQSRNTVSLGRFSESYSDRDIFVIGLVCDIRSTKNGHTALELEDPTGRATAILLKDRGLEADRLVLDEVIGVKGGVSNGTLFVDELVFPDVMYSTGVSRIRDPLSAVFISDTHFGSKEFLPKVEAGFLKWLRESKETASVKYVCIAGDVVDGVGIYPGQKKDLTITDIHAQYAAFEEFVQKIPEHIHVIICPGNHDAVRQAEPQPPLTHELLPAASHLSNIYLVPNPAFVRLHSMENARGITVLMYHGYSFTSIINSITPLRGKAMTQPELVMRELLRKRHLAPSYGSTIILPDSSDRLVIDRTPDIFHTGDLHSFGLDTYKNVTMVSSSTFQDQTAFMDRVGHIANPGKVTVINLQTRSALVKDFMR